LHALRHRIPAEHRSFVGALIVFAFFWLAADAGNELFWWSRLFGFPQMAMSPFFLMIVSFFAMKRCSGLLSAENAVGIISAGLKQSQPAWDLSARETEIYTLLAAGLENADISEKLFISPHTLKNHVSNIYRKAGAKNRLDLIRIAGLADSIPPL
jgi:DNA-binding CsgD family transcriptional regulator